MATKDENGKLLQRDDWATMEVIATFSGKEVSEKPPTFALIFTNVWGVRVELIFIADGVRLKSPVISGESRISMVNVDVPSFKTLGRSNKVEGQIGYTEFELDPSQIALIAEVYKQAGGK